MGFLLVIIHISIFILIITSCSLTVFISRVNFIDISYDNLRIYIFSQILITFFTETCISTYLDS